MVIRHGRILINKNNLGVAKSRNKAIKQSKGEFIAFLDSDDYWHADFLKISLKYLQHSTYTFVFSNTIAFGTGITRNKRNFINAPNSIFPDLLVNKRSWATSACLWQKKIIGQTRFINSRNWEDYVFDSEVALKNNKIKYIPHNLCFYDLEGDDKLSKGSTGETKNERLYSVVKLFDVLKKTAWLKNKKIKFFFLIEFYKTLENYHFSNLKPKIKKKEVMNRLIILDKKNFFVSIVYRFFPPFISLRFVHFLKERLKVKNKNFKK